MLYYKNLKVLVKIGTGVGFEPISSVLETDILAY